MFEIGHALAILHRMTARTAFPFAGRSRPNPSGELESQQVLLTWQTLTIAQRNGLPLLVVEHRSLAGSQNCGVASHCTKKCFQAA